MKILFLTANKLDATSFYRGAGIVKDLSLQSGATIDLYDWDEVKLDWSKFVQYDLVYMQRPLTSSCVDAAMYIKMMGIRLWIDWDDDYINIPTWHYFVLSLQGGIKNIETLAGLADIITVTNKALYEVYTAFNNNIMIIPNSIPASMLIRTNNNSSGGILWRGSYLHFPNVFQYANELLAVSAKAKITFMGLNPFFLNSYKMLAEMELYNYFTQYKKMAPKFTFVVFKDHVFNRGRSNIAWIEATLAGTVCLAPDWEEWKMPGIVNYSTPQDFIDKFMDMTEQDMQSNYEKSFEYISDNLTLEKVNKLRVAILWQKV